MKTMPEKFKKVGQEGTLMWLKNWLDLEMKPLWPKGWMQARILLRISKSVHQKLTGFGVPVKKADVVDLTKVENKPPIKNSKNNPDSIKNNSSSQNSLPILNRDIVT